uniref:G_PROTEIN_RECEP_F1_2 domain-containing protein n=1 Tax=Ascaris lumbricoides TaxID=6252 RepID=A0A0M3I715_ASCLU
MCFHDGDFPFNILLFLLPVYVIFYLVAILFIRIYMTAIFVKKKDAINVDAVIDM